jgi:hypothetical protein
MQPRYSISPQPAIQSVPPNSHPGQLPSSDDIAKIFNTAVVATQAETKRDFSAELCQITQSAPFKAILSAVRHLSRVQGISEKQAAEHVVQTFRKMDEIWKQYLYREGLEHLRNQRR